MPEVLFDVCILAGVKALYVFRESIPIVVEYKMSSLIESKKKTFFFLFFFKGSEQEEPRLIYRERITMSFYRLFKIVNCVSGCEVTL